MSDKIIFTQLLAYLKYKKIFFIYCRSKKLFLFSNMLFIKIANLRKEYIFSIENEIYYVFSLFCETLLIWEIMIMCFYK